MNTMQENRSEFCVPSSHPCLPGHFPGQPLVPAVVMLDQVAARLRAWRNVRVSRLLSARFSAPLLPDQRATLLLRTQADDCRFSIHCGEREIARGRMETAA